MAAIHSGGQAVEGLSGEQAVCSEEAEGSGPGWDQEAVSGTRAGTLRLGMAPHGAKGPALPD